MAWTIRLLSRRRRLALRSSLAQAGAVEPCRLHHRCLHGPLPRQTRQTTYLTSLRCAFRSASSSISAKSPDSLINTLTPPAAAVRTRSQLRSRTDTRIWPAPTVSGRSGTSRSRRRLCWILGQPSSAASSSPELAVDGADLLFGSSRIAAAPDVSLLERSRPGSSISAGLLRKFRPSTGTPILTLNRLRDRLQLRRATGNRLFDHNSRCRPGRTPRPQLRLCRPGHPLRLLAHLRPVQKRLGTGRPRSLLPGSLSCTRGNFSSIP